jgi:uncharacterized protein DUF3105
MAKKKRRRRPPARPSAARNRPGTGTTSRQAVAERDSQSKDETRRLRRETARRQAHKRLQKMRRRQLLRRGLAAAVVVAALGAGVFYFQGKRQAKNRVAAQGRQIAAAAGCTDVVTEPDRGNSHQPPYVYQQHPATSGSHGTPLPADQHVYRQPVPEENAVHNLEHGYVLVYYRRTGKPTLSAKVVDDLERLAKSQSKVIVAPYARLETRKALALVAWNKLQQCPSTIKPDQGDRLARAFIAQFRSGGDAPEPAAP